MESDPAKIKEATIQSLGFNKIGKLSNFTQMQTQLKKTVVDKFGERHWEVRPFDHKELMEICAKYNLKIEDLKVKPSGLLHNACNAPNCPFFMKITNEVQLKKHLDTWQGKMPLGFHKFVAAHQEKESEVIFNKLCSEKKFNLDLFKVSKEFTLNYIEKVKNYYAQIPKEEITVIRQKIEEIDSVLNKAGYRGGFGKVEKKKKEGQGAKGKHGRKGNKGARGRGNARGRGRGGK